MWSGRSWASLMVNHVSPIQSAMFLVYAGLMVLVLWRQRRGILARPAAVERLRKRLDFAKPLLPHTAAERRLFWAVSATAGICEETLYRGFLTWYIAGWTGTGMHLGRPLHRGLDRNRAQLADLRLGHFYLGVKQVPRTALVGWFWRRWLIFQDRCGRRLCST